MIPTWRVRNLFRGVSSESCASAQKTYPVEKPCKNGEPLRSHLWLSAHSGGIKRCGRRRDRHRRLFRQSFRLRFSSLALRIGTVNTQGFQWNLARHESKLKALVSTMRRHSFDVLMVSDLHYTGSVQTSIVYVEEFCFVLRGAVGLIMRNAVAVHWERQGRELVHRPDSDRLLGVVVQLFGRSMAMVANYTPAGTVVGMKRAHYDAARSLHAELHECGHEQIWGGDFNGHLGGGDGDGVHFGNYGLPTATTMGGRMLKEFAVRCALCHVDSWRSIACRGTWYHNICHKWFELDAFLVEKHALSHVQQMMFTFAARGISDHMGKAMHVHLGAPSLRAKRQKRKKCWQGVRAQQRPGSSDVRVTCQHAMLRGSSPSAVQMRSQYEQLVDSALQTAGVEAPDAFSEISAVEGWEETAENIWHVYTDGSAVLEDPSAGWGAAWWVRGQCYESFGPVEVNPNSEDFIGAERLTNNTGELSAVARVLTTVAAVQHLPSTLIIHYDSQYAANVTQGLWSVRRNRCLAGLARKKYCEVKQKCQIEWRWIKGHSGNMGNELADRLADRGRQGQSRALPFALAPLQPQAPAVRRRLHSKTAFRDAPATAAQVPPPVLDWPVTAEVLTGAVDAVAGKFSAKRRGAPLSAADKTRLEDFDDKVANAWDAVRRAQGCEQEQLSLQQWRLAKRRRKDFLKKARLRFVQSVVEQLHTDLNHHDWGRFYHHLKSLGVSTEGCDFTGHAPFSLKQLREHNLRVSDAAKSVDLGVIDASVPQQAVAHELGDLPAWTEFMEAMRSVKDSSPGKDGVSILMIQCGGRRLHQEIYATICRMWCSDAEQWALLLRTGLGVTLLKEGDRNDLDNYRAVVLLPMVSRILSRIISCRVRDFAEKRRLFRHSQYGNRRQRSVNDALLLVRTVLELAAEVVQAPNSQVEQEDAVVALFFDIRKAFPSINREAAFHLFSRLGMPDSLLRVLDALHSGTLYQATSSEGLSEVYSLQSGFREGCSTSPILYTLYHDHAMGAFASKVEELRRRSPQHFLELHSWTGKRMNQRMTRGRLPKLDKILAGPSIQTHNLLDVNFADDTSILCRDAVRAQLE